MSRSTKINGTSMVIQRLSSSFSIGAAQEFLLNCLLLGTSICWLQLHRSRHIIAMNSKNAPLLEDLPCMMHPLTFLKGRNLIGYIRLKAYGKA